MNIVAWVSAGVVLGTLGGAKTSGEEFPFEFQTIPAEQVMTFPGGYGMYAQLRAIRPSGLTKQPKAFSHAPLYGVFKGGPHGDVLFRLDESGGTGRGYDRLIADLNHNGDLTDDPVVEPADVSGPGANLRSTQLERVLFGPIHPSDDARIAGGRPVYYAQAYIYNRQALSGVPDQNAYVGQLHLKAGWFLQTTVALAGIKQKLGLFDGDSDLRLGVGPSPVTYRNPGSPESWYFSNGDSFLIDADSSGTFESDPFQSEWRPFAPVVYLGATPYRVALTGGTAGVRIEPCQGPLAEVRLEPHGDQVREVTLAWKNPQAEWQLIRAIPSDGKLRLPSGSYRLYGCVVRGVGQQGEVAASAYQRLPEEPFVFEAGKSNVLTCGAPLQMNVTAEKRSALPYEPLVAKSDGDSEFVLSINTQIRGRDGEIYSAFGAGERAMQPAPKPTFTVVDASGKQRANGNLEFG